MLRTHLAQEIGAGSEGQDVKLAGWVSTVRDHGGLIFVDLRDETGVIQFVFDPRQSAEVCARAKALSSEDVIQVSGKVRKRPKGTENPGLASGMVEVGAEVLVVLNNCEPLPFVLDEKAEASEEVRLKFRYLDLRRPGGLRGLKIRDKVIRAMRAYYEKEGFLEVETPFLWKSTPEGARDFLVPSRKQPGQFYALPQSPQLLKQILMASGVGKYYQIARCFRDEDLRGNRQFEFTQIDVEMSFVEEEDIFTVAEGMLENVFKAAGFDLGRPVKRLAYKEAVAKYGTDKPDLRFGLEIGDATEGFTESASDVVRRAVAKGARVKALALPAAVSDLKRSQLDELETWAKEAGAAGLSWFRAGSETMSPLVKRMGEGERKALGEAACASAGQWVFAAFEAEPRISEFMGLLRAHLGRKFSLAGSGLAPVWIYEFPLLVRNPEENIWDAAHNPFSAPFEEDLPLLDSDPGRARARQYDLIINGEEILGGSIRNHNPEVQRKILALLGFRAEVMEDRFGFFLKALSHGAPPHGGFAGGVERLVMILGGFDSIRDTIAFPKTQRGMCLLSGAPGPVEPAQLKELHLKITERGKGSDEETDRERAV